MLFDAVADQACLRQLDFSPDNGFSSLMWSFAKLRVRHPRLLACAAQNAPGTLRLFKPNELSSLAWSFAALDEVDERLFRAIAECVEMSAAVGFETRHLSNISWAFAKLELRSPKLFTIIVGESRRKLAHFKSQEMTNLAWALGKLQVEDPHLLESIGSYAARIGPKFKSQELANLTWAFAVLDVKIHGFLGMLKSEVPRRISEFTPQGLSMVLWSFAKLEVDSPSLLAVLMKQAAFSMQTFGPQDIANHIWSLATLAAYDDQLLRALAEHATRQLDHARSSQLSNMAWGFATLAVQDTEMFQLIGRAALVKLNDLTLQELCNLVWAFSSVNVLAPKLLHAVADELHDRLEDSNVDNLPDASLTKLVLDTISAAWAFNSAGMTCKDFLVAARKLVHRIGQVMDHGTVIQSTAALPDQFQQHGHSIPSIVVDLKDRMVVLKPPGWQVDTEGEASVGQLHRVRYWLSEYVQARLTSRACPIVSDTTHHCGFLHRLDVPSSGLLLVAKTYTAYYDLQLQLNTGSLRRDYLVLLHGWMPLGLRDVRLHVYSRQGHDSPSSIRREGKPCRTCLVAVAWCSRWRAAVVLDAVRIGTGRTHQIRVCSAHLGHPTVTDGKYTGSDTFKSDSAWCRRNFLHRGRLGFQDLDGLEQEALQPLPEHLLTVLQSLTLVRGESADGMLALQTLT